MFNSFTKGFIKRAAEFGMTPEIAEELYKQAAPVAPPAPTGIPNMGARGGQHGTYINTPYGNVSSNMSNVGQNIPRMPAPAQNNVGLSFHANVGMRDSTNVGPTSSNVQPKSVAPQMTQSGPPKTLGSMPNWGMPQRQGPAGAPQLAAQMRPQTGGNAQIPFNNPLGSSHLQPSGGLGGGARLQPSGGLTGAALQPSSRL